MTINREPKKYNIEPPFAHELAEKLSEHVCMIYFEFIGTTNILTETDIKDIVMRAAEKLMEERI